MNVQNIVLILGIVGSLSLAGVALYRARPQRELDSVTAEKVEQEVKAASEQYDREKTIRILRLERYVTKDVMYHRKNTIYQGQLAQLLEHAIVSGLLPEGTVMPEPPEPPELPDVES